MRLMKKVLTRMTAGLVFVWTHKLLQADVVRLMDELGMFTRLFIECDILLMHLL